MNKALYKRRQFLRNAAAISLLGSGQFAMNGKLNLLSSALASSGDYATVTDYKSLVCVFLYGGADSFNMFLPADGSLLDAYTESRGGLALDSSTLLQDSSGADIQFNPQLANLHSLFQGGDLAVVRNAGNLIAPVTRSDYLSDSLDIPADLFAHNHQQEQALKGYSSQPTTLVGAGWGGRMADMLLEANQGALFPPIFALNGSDWWSSGSITKPVRLGAAGLSRLTFLDSQTGSNGNAARENVFASLLTKNYQNPLMREAAQSLLRSRDSSRQFDSAFDAMPPLATPYSQESKLATQLRMVARLISVQQSLGMKRQIFFVGLGGWDTHDNQTLRLDELLPQFDKDMFDFYQTLNELNRLDSVTTFTASDFGRTLTINGDGSDHGWGGHYMVMGGGVDGGKLFGEWPSFETGSADDTGDKGRVIPKLSINQIGATLGQWMGLSTTDAGEIFPDLSNFGSDWQSNIRLFG